jgi:hypothetical protein
VDVRGRYESIKAHFGWAIAIIGCLRWLADLWGEGEVIKEWASHLPRLLQILASPQAAPVLMLVGLGLYLYSRYGNLPWLDNRVKYGRECLIVICLIFIGALCYRTYVRHAATSPKSISVAKP